MEYIEIKEQIKQKLPVARDLGDSENLLELGLSSLTIMRLVNQWRKQGVKVSFGSLMENPTLEGWWALIQRSMSKIMFAVLSNSAYDSPWRTSFTRMMFFSSTAVIKSFVLEANRLRTVSNAFTSFSL